MHNRSRPLSAIAALFAFAFSARIRPALPQFMAPPGKRRFDKARGYDVYRAPQIRGKSRYRPHQSTRECLRRIGGGMWEQFKRDDRVRRGLPADKQKGE